MKRMILLALLVASLALSCNKDVLKGDGDNVTRTIGLVGFTGVETHYGIRAEISYGSTQQITATGHQSLINALETDIEDNVLKLRYRGNYTKVRNENLVVRIQLPSLERAIVHGSSEISVDGFSGCPTFDGTISGSGGIRVTGSDFKNAILRINGSGNIEARGLRVENATANINGSGNVSVSVSGLLKANIYGSGNVYYWGNPILQIEPHGSGRAIKK